MADKFYPYATTRDILRNRHGATEREIATWVMFSCPEPSSRRLDEILANQEKIGRNLEEAAKRNDLPKVAVLVVEQQRLATDEMRERENMVQETANYSETAHANENLVAYENVNRYPSVIGSDEMLERSLKRKSSEEWNPEKPRYLDLLWDMSFMVDAVNCFTPKRRYISFSDLTKTWVERGYCESHEEVVTAISSLVRQEVLFDIVPIFGVSRMHSGNQSEPPAEWAMFDRSNVEDIEKQYFSPLGQSQIENSENIPDGTATECKTQPAPLLSKALSESNIFKPTLRLAEQKNPWEVANPKDPKPEQSWYVPARYFARNFVKEDSTLLAKRDHLADKVCLALFNAGYKKRGGKKKFSPGTVLKALTNVSLG